MTKKFKVQMYHEEITRISSVCGCTESDSHHLAGARNVTIDFKNYDVLCWCLCRHCTLQSREKVLKFVLVASDNSNRSTFTYRCWESLSMPFHFCLDLGCI